MEIKSFKYHGIFVMIGLILGVSGFFTCLVGGPEALVGGCLYFILAGVTLFCALWSWVLYGRIFVFDETGCTVILGKYKKHYAWSQLKYIQLRSCRNTFYPSRTEKKPDERMLFSTKPIKVPRSMDFLVYSMYFAPMSGIFVGFYTHPRNVSMFRGKPFEGEKIYIAPKEEFLQKLKEWGVEYEVYE